MSLFARLRSDGTPKGTVLAPEPEPRSISGEELWWPVGGTGSAGIPVTETTALQFAAHLATLITLATDVAVLPLNVYQRLPNGGRRDAREHPADALLSWTPDGEMTPLNFKQAWMGHALQYGTGYAEIERKGRGTPVALHLLDPVTTCRRTLDDGRSGYDLGAGKWLPSSNVLRLAGFSFDGMSGYNLVRLMRQSLGLGLAAETFGADYFSNGSEPGGVIKHPKVLKPEARENLRRSFEEKHRGAGQRHRVALLEEGAEWAQTATEPEKSQLLETRKFQVLDVLRPWRLPPHKAGDFSQAHLANIEASNLDYLMTALMGWLTAIEQECDLKLFSPAEHAAGFYVEHNVNALLRGDIESRFRAYETGVRNGWFSRNDVRKRENMNPIPADKGGDLYTVQSQNIPLEQVSNPPEPAPGPMPGLSPAPNGNGKRHNPNHGKDGKFSSGKGGGGGGGKGGGGGAAMEVLEEAATPTGAKIKQYHDAMSKDWRESLTYGEGAAVKTYTGGTYKTINEFNRKGGFAEGSDPYKNALSIRTTKVLDDVMSRASLPEPLKVYRGVADVKAAGISVGATLHDKTFLSTSLSPKVARMFSTSKEGAILEIVAPRGARGASVAKLTKHPGEREVLFARDARIKITGERVEKGDRIFTGELSHD